jgi:hypothetical protein
LDGLAQPGLGESVLREGGGNSGILAIVVRGAVWGGLFLQLADIGDYLGVLPDDADSAEEVAVALVGAWVRGVKWTGVGDDLPGARRQLVSEALSGVAESLHAHCSQDRAG